ncbi:hypothetical protein ZWY2020_008081 [Hordeum vulgare]|nr:hypothetical protein ZWY2020_008081 [Hordeum vulgare]
MRNSKDPRTKILPSTTRRGKELPSSSALDSPSVLSKFATSPPARNLDMSPVLDDATSDAYDAMLDTIPDDAMLDAMPAMPDTALPLGAFLDAQIARVAARCDDISETADTIEVEPATMPELPVMPDTRYVMEGEIAEDFPACKDNYDVEKLLRKWKEKSLNARMKYDPKFATSPIFVTDKDYEFFVDPELITLVESDPFHGYESETVVAHLTKLHDIATLFTSEEKIRHYYMLKMFPFSLKDDAKTWFTSLAPGCVRSPQDMVYYFSETYFPAHEKQAAMQEIYNFAQAEEESLPQAWGRLIQLLNALPDRPLEKNEILDIFYNGLTDGSKDHLDSCAGSVFRERTIEQAEILLSNILCNENAWTIPEPPPKPTPKKRGILFLSPEDMQEAKKSMREKGIKSKDVKNLPPIEEIHGLDNPIQVEQVLKAQNDLLNELNDNYVRVVTRGGRMTHEPLYPDGHPKRIEQDSQGVSTDAPSHPRKKKEDDRNLHASNPVAATPESPNDASVSDAETQSGDEQEPNDNIYSDVHEDAQPSNDKDVEIEPSVDLDNPQPKNRIYNKNDFTSRKHGKEREPWVQKPMLFPPKPSKKKDDEDFERFVEMIRPVFLQMCLTDMLKMSPYAKYMKDIMTNKRRIPEVEISSMLANYTFKGGIPKKLGDPGVPTIPCSIKDNYVRTALCDLGAGVSVMPLSLYRRLELDKLTPTEISLQMADKSTAFLIGICEDVPVVVANTTILTDFVILDIPKDDAMADILGRPFLNTPGAVIDCNKGNVTFHVNGNEHTVHFPKKQYRVHCINAIEKTSSILIGRFECPIPRVKMKYDLLVGEIRIPIEVT